MKITKMLFELGNDFRAMLVCEHCGHEQEDPSGYHDNYYHRQVIPAIYCESCGKNRWGKVKGEV